MHFIVQDNVPCWHYLSYAENLLQVHIHPTVDEYLADALTLPLPIIDDLGKELKIDPFVFTTDRWGFSSVSRWMRQEDGWNTLCLPYPKTQRSVAECLSPSDEKILFALSATLNVVFTILNGFDGSTEDPSSQSMTLQIYKACSMCGGALSADLSPAFRSWLKSLPNENPLKSASKKMMEAYHWLWDKEGVFDRYDFLASTDACGSLYLKLGYDKGLAPDYQPPLDDEGYRISSTNVDHPAHQLALLAGLAELSQWFHRTSANAKSA